VDLAPDCSAAEVSVWLDAGNTKKLADFLRRRHASRFFDPIESLKKSSNTYSGYGFSMMALCCLLTETIECYRQGLPTSSRKEWGELVDIQNKESVPIEYRLAATVPTSGADIFVRFFTDFQAMFADVDGLEFYHNIRNGLLHQAQTKGGWTIDALGSLVCDRTRRRLNRNLFSRALHDCFEQYVGDLETKPWNDARWKCAGTKIWWLIRISK
jgi:hypothetical protein